MPVEEVARTVPLQLVAAAGAHLVRGRQVDDEHFLADPFVSSQDGVWIVVPGVADALEVALQAREQLTHLALACCSHRLQR